MAVPSVNGDAPAAASSQRRRISAGGWLAVAVALTIAGAGALAAWLATSTASPPPSGAAAARVDIPPPPPAAAEPPKPAVAAAGPPALDTAPDAPAGKPPPPSSSPAAPEPAAVTSPKTPGLALLSAPDPDLVEPRGDAVLPAIGRDGRQPWEAYARPFDRADRRPRIAIVISSLGLERAATEAAIGQAPGAVTLAFSPHARRLQDWVDRARAAGHEVLINLPMEPFDYPKQDPGPNTLLASVDAQQNLERLDWVMSRAAGYVGVAGFMGARFVTSANDVKPVLEALKGRGLLFLDNGASPQSAARAIAAQLGMPRATSDRFIDGDPTRAAIEKRLADLEDLARRNGGAVGIGVAYPLTLERVADWAKALDDKGLALAPLSAVAVLQSVPVPASSARREARP